MKNIKFIIGAIVAIAIVGAYFFPKSTHTTVLQAGAVGDTNSTQRIAQIVMDMTTTTPASILNGDATDRIITSIDYYLASLTSVTSNGSGLANFTFLLSTSTNVYTAASANYLLNTTVATTTAQLFVASTTPGNTALATLAGVNTRVWKAGTYLNVFANGTSTATGTIKISYIVSQ